MFTGSTLVMVADGAVARFLSRGRPGARLVELVDSRMHISPLALERDRPARMNDRVGSGRHAIEPRLSPRAAAEEAFLKEAAGRALELLRSGQASQFVICAPPRALGILRNALTPDARERLTLSWGKDLTKETPAEIDRRLRDLKA